MEREDNNKDQLDDQQPSPVILNSDAKQVESFSPMRIKKRPVTSTITSVLPSSVNIENAQDQYLKSRISSPENKNGKSTPNNALTVTPRETQGPTSVSSFNLAHLTE